MNDFEKCTRDCKVGIKAFQNIRASLEAFEQLVSLVDSENHVLLGGLFHSAVVTYAKPFLSTNFGSGLIKYPMRHLSKVNGFSNAMHDHLLHVRNTLVAHDDFEEIEPRVLMMTVNVSIEKGSGPWSVPMSISVANKRISHPADLDGASKMRTHVRAVMQGVQQKLFNDIGTLRAVALKCPDQAETPRYSKAYGDQHIPVDGARLKIPTTSDDPWLNPDEPNFNVIHNGFCYEQAVLKRDFNGPERIVFPDGSSFVIRP